MATAPLVIYCESCHALQPSQWSIRVSGGGSVTVRNCVTNCPRCGGMAYMLDAVYSAVQETLTAIVTQKLSEDQVRQFTEILESAQDKGTSAAEIAEEIKSQAPQFARFADWISEHKEWLAKETFKAMLLLAVGIAVTRCQPTSSPSQPNTNVNINNSVNVEMVVQDAVREIDPAVTPEPEMGSPETPPTSQPETECEGDEPT